MLETTLLTLCFTVPAGSESSGILDEWARGASELRSCARTTALVSAAQGGGDSLMVTSLLRALETESGVSLDGLAEGEGLTSPLDAFALEAT